MVKGDSMLDRMNFVFGVAIAWVAWVALNNLGHAIKGVLDLAAHAAGGR